MTHLEFVQSEHLRFDLPELRTGQTVRVHVRITEGTKERVQVFEGTVLRVRGSGLDSTFTVRKISNGVGVERIFPFDSPNVDRVEVKARGRVRQSRLYYLRGLTGKAARIRERTFDKAAALKAKKARRAAAKAAKAAAEAAADPPTADGE